MLWTGTEYDEGMTTTDHAYIAEDLRQLAVPIANLNLLPGNPRRGDVDAVARSYQRFGQRKPIVARRSDMTVIAGNHQLQAAQQLGWTHLAVVWTDDDDATATAFALADNRTGDLGGYDDTDLINLLQQVADDGDLLAATGYSDAYLTDLLKRYSAPTLADLEDMYADDEMPSEKLAIIKLNVRKDVADRWEDARRRIAGSLSSDADEAIVNYLLDLAEH